MFIIFFLYSCSSSVLFSVSKFNVLSNLLQLAQEASQISSNSGSFKGHAPSADEVVEGAAAAPPTDSTHAVDDTAPPGGGGGGI